MGAAASPLVTLRVDGVPEQRVVHFREARAGQVVVVGIWSVVFCVDAEDMRWIRDLAARHESVALECGGRAFWSFEAARDDGHGYCMNVDFADEAAARRVAEELMARQGAQGG